MRWLKNLAKVLISVGLLGYLVITSDPQQIVNVLGNVIRSEGLPFLLLAIAITMVSIGLMTVRWRSLLHQYEVGISSSRLYGFYLVGLFFNNFLPTSIGGDIVRIYSAAADSDNRTAAFASVIIERIMGIAATLFLAITSLYYVSHYFQDQRILLVSVFLLIAIITFFVMITRERPVLWLLRIFDKFTLLNLGEKINKLIEAMHFLRDRRRVFVWVFFLSVLSQAAIVLMNYALCLALRIEVELLYLFLVVPVTFLLTMLPSINGLGLRDGGFVFLLGKMGVSSAASISLALLNVIVPMVISLWGAVLFAVQRKSKGLKDVKAIKEDF